MRTNEILSSRMSPSAPALRRPLNSALNMLRFTSVPITALLVVAAACAQDPLAGLPPVAGRVAPTAIEFDWPWCDARIPPLTDCGEFGSVSDIGGFISEQTVCSLVVAMQEWLAARKWDRVENVKVCRTSQWVYPPKLGESIALDRPKVWTTRIEADIPEHSIRLRVFLREDSGEISFDIDTM